MAIKATIRYPDLSNITDFVILAALQRLTDRNQPASNIMRFARRHNIDVKSSTLHDHLKKMVKDGYVERNDYSDNIHPDYIITGLGKAVYRQYADSLVGLCGPRLNERVAEIPNKEKTTLALDNIENIHTQRTTPTWFESVIQEPNSRFSQKKLLNFKIIEDLEKDS